LSRWLVFVYILPVGSITLRAEHDVLASAAGRDAVASGPFDGLAAFFEDRPLAVRIGLADDDAAVPNAVPGDGPPFWPAVAPEGPMRLRLTNNGSEAWPSDLELVAGWEPTDQPYLAFPPDELGALGLAIPPLAPGESVVVEASLPSSPEGRSVAWISLREGSELFSDLGSPALQVSSQAP
jgi:hypothetical protein